MRVAVLGCGPAGLFAAHGALLGGAEDVRIISTKRPSQLYGCQYLHKPIPGLTTSLPRSVLYKLQGEPDSYRAKVYGDHWDGTVSPEDLEDDHLAWDLRATYRNAYAAYSQYIIDSKVYPSDVPSLLKEFDLVISSIPAPVLCVGDHLFRSRAIKAAGQTDDRALPYDAEDGVILCNGEDSPSWYRLSRVFGYSTVEWPEYIEPPISHATVDKPLDNKCDCWPEVIRVGRYGKWEKGILTHDAFEAALDVVGELM